MPKTRTAAAETIAAAINPVEQIVQLASIDANRCVATLFEQRLRAQLAPHIGADVLALASDGAHHLVQAANCFGLAHQRLSDLGQDLGLGPQCPPNEGSASIVPLRAVA